MIHNHEVPGSIPGPATKKRLIQCIGRFLYVYYLLYCRFCSTFAHLFDPLMKKNISFLLCLLPLFLFAETMPAGYYDRIDGTHDAELKATLKTIIRKHTAIPYGKGKGCTWEVFYYADRDENGYCEDMYSDDWKPLNSPGAVASGCNIEHSFAKSWWGGAENDAYKDCYHLNPSNSHANSSRSNYPLGVPKKNIKSDTGSLRVGKIYHDSLKTDFWVFEPKDEYKGDFARAYFYMATCYGRDINGNPDAVCSEHKGWRLDNKDVGARFAMQNDNYLEFQPWEIEVLIQWHRQDPVSKKELKRMDAVSNFQHNRNPFIEYPCLAEYIWGNRKGQNVVLADLKNTYDADYLDLPANKKAGCPCETEADIETPEEQAVHFRKVLRNGVIIIERDGVLYNLLGNRL